MKFWFRRTVIKIHFPRMIAFGLIGLTLLAMACGGDDDDGAPVAQSPDGSRGSAAGALPADCAALPYTVSLKAGDAIDAAAFEVVSAKAVSLAGGAGYTVYLADYEIPDDEIGAFTNPSLADGQTLVTLFVTTFNPSGEPEIPAKGQVIPYTRDFGVLTFGVVPQHGETSFGTTMSAEGSLTVIETGDYFCAEIEYQDSDNTTDVSAVQNRLAGAIAAEVVLAFD